MIATLTAVLLLAACVVALSLWSEVSHEPDHAGIEALDPASSTMRGVAFDRHGFPRDTRQPIALRR